MIIKHGDKIHPAIFLQNQRRIPRSATNSEGHIINLFRIKEILFLRLRPGNKRAGLIAPHWCIIISQTESETHQYGAIHSVSAILI